MGMPPAGVCALIGAAFLTIYFLIWLMRYLSYKRKVKNMNAKLRAWKNSEIQNRSTIKIDRLVKTTVRSGCTSIK